MPLPDKEYFTLDEIARRWRVPPADVEHFAKTEKLEVCVPLLPVDAEGGTYDELGSVPNFQEQQERGCYPIVLEDLWTVLHRGEVKTSRLKPYEGHAYLTIAKEITVTRDELVVTHAELERFEAAHGITVAHTQPSSPSDDQGMTDGTGLPGRPTSWDLLEPEFSRRVEAGMCLGTLAAEAKELLEWFVKRYPRAHRPTQKTIENRIRTVYNERVRSHPPK